MKCHGSSSYMSVHGNLLGWYRMQLQCSRTSKDILSHFAILMTGVLKQAVAVQNKPTHCSIILPKPCWQIPGFCFASPCDSRFVCCSIPTATTSNAQICCKFRVNCKLTYHASGVAPYMQCQCFHCSLAYAMRGCT